MDPEDFRRHGHALIDWIADYRAGIASLPVQSAVEPGALKAAFPSHPPEQPEDPSDVLRDLEALVLPGLTHWQHPSFFGWFPANADLSSVLGDLASASPALTELEEVVVDWARQLVGLSEGWRGVIQDTASTSTLVALLCARERATGFGFGAGPPTAVYASAQAHSSVGKAALLAGMRLREVPVDERWSMGAEVLRQMMAEDRAAGVLPAAVVATTGTTTTTAVDPIAAVVAVAAEHRAWVHVDAAMAGTAQLLPEARSMWAGVEGADSIVWNAHKWLGAVFDCSIYLLRDPEHLTRVMSTNPSYLRTAFDDRVANLRDWGLPLGRRFRALKLWYLLRTEGVAAIQARLRRDMDNARWLAEQVAATPGWRVLAPVVLQTVCLRHEPEGCTGEALDAHTLGWAERINTSGAALVTPAMLNGRWMVRVSVGALGTEREHVAQLWQRMQATAG